MKSQLLEALHYADAYNTNKESVGKMWESWTEEQHEDAKNHIREKYTNEQIASHLLGVLFVDEFWEAFEYHRDGMYNILKDKHFDLCSNLESSINTADRLLLTHHVTNRFDEGDYQLVDMYFERVDSFKDMLLLLLNEFRGEGKYPQLVKNMNKFMS